MENYSVLMSLYKNEKPGHLKLALDSMINQTISPDEIVMVYDGPLTKELYSIMDNYIANYPYLFNIIKNEKNLGLGKSLNKGLLLCKNELIARMDTDDISRLDRCEKQLNYFKYHPNISILGGQIEEFIDCIENKVSKRIVPCKDGELKNFLKKRCPFNHMTVMFKKNDILNVGNYQDWFWNEDYYLWIRLALNNCEFANLSCTLVDVRIGKDMYQRRGGLKYFISEKRLQKYMLKIKIINYFEYLRNVIIRFFVQVLISNRLRGFLLKNFARNK